MTGHPRQVDISAWVALLAPRDKAEVWSDDAMDAATGEVDMRRLLRLMQEGG